MLLFAVSLMFTGVFLTLAGHLAFMILGVTLLTIGLFGGHAVASAWVSSRAPVARAQAASLYLFFYYTGSSLLGSAGGEFYSHGGWDSVAGLVSAALLLALLIAALLNREEKVRNNS
jgi:YNFM family putative membrane transporter